jgi:hypothetical protein
MAVKEEVFEGSVSGMRKSEFVDAIEDLAGKTRKNPASLTIERMVMVSGAIGADGKAENNVFSAIITKTDRRLRINATKRKMLITASGSNKALDWTGLKIALYQTVDSDRSTGGKTSVQAIAMDVQRLSDGVWLRYYDYQQAKGKKHVVMAGLISSELA